MVLIGINVVMLPSMHFWYRHTMLPSMHLWYRHAMLPSVHLWCRHAVLLHLLLMMRHSLHLLLLLLLNHLLRCRLISSVLLLFDLKSHLVLRRHGFVPRLLLGRERTPPFPQDPPHVNEFNSQELSHDDRPHLVRKEYIGSGGPFWCVGVFGATFGAGFGR